MRKSWFNPSRKIRGRPNTNVKRPVIKSKSKEIDSQEKARYDNMTSREQDQYNLNKSRTESDPYASESESPSLLDKLLIFLGLKEGCPCCDGGVCSCSADCKSCDCGSTKEAEDQENLSGGGDSISHLNPTEVHGAQDIYGAEGGHGRVFGSRIGAYNYNVPVGSPAFQVPPNPRSYQTPSGLYHDSYMMDFNGDLRPAYGEVWDNWNDMLPEYRFPRPWSPSYHPRWSGRPADYQVQQVSTGRRPL